MDKKEISFVEQFYTAVMTAEGEDVEVETLLRQFLQALGRLPDVERITNTHDQREIILDALFNGVRYTVICTYPSRLDPYANLSPREQEIARLVAQGYGNKMVAAHLTISTHTVASHMKRIFSKLRVNTRAEMVARVYEDPLLALDA